MMAITAQTRLARGRSLGLTGAAAIVSAAAFCFLWGALFLMLLTSGVPADDDALAGVIGATAILAGLALCAWASWTLSVYRAVGPAWAILLPIALSAGWAAATLGIESNSDFFIAIGPLPALLAFCVVSGMTIPIGLGLTLVYLILRFSPGSPS
ncbi:hypothetical protein [Agromyces sp. NPDC058110]|uniref:hypothetical protein n=1 Tax=Agromyces sp. NPDC058110 TaxID=3346345 RepID=UPI0036D91373